MIRQLMPNASRFCLAAAVFTSSIVTSPAASQTTYNLYFLGGQSNMDGYGFVSDLPEDLRGPMQGVVIFHGNPAPDDSSTGGLGVWRPLRAGHGVGFSSDGASNSYSVRFGVELTFAQRLRALNPDANIAIIKYSRGGSSIDVEAAGQFGSWEPDYDGRAGVNQYDHFLATVRNAMSVDDVDGDGNPDELVPAGIIWMQGESDAAYTAEIAFRYRKNLERLIDLIRAAFHADDLAAVIGRISDSGQDEDGKVWDHGDVVRAAQAAFVDQDAAAAVVTSTDAYAYSDTWHYDSPGFMDLGRRFAEALVELKERR